ncbi:MAG: ATP-NAD kinase [Gammaproteobacteria bacterium]|nr:ATP-NAD kinase [Gammaproteobacteria bacterium]|tara:strand:+ start:1400 stop:2524 length:1125 start_codon:yes stop_codon:yes gene_type:complete
MNSRRLRVGLVMNPLAGIGGPAALKGSDDRDLVDQARLSGVESKVLARTCLSIEGLAGVADRVEFVTFAGEMGEAALKSSGHHYKVVGDPDRHPTSAEDTRRAIELLQAESVDIILFAGGDGTAGDVCDVVKPGQVVLGIPCGVKMHSGVFANSPVAAGKIVCDIALGKLTTVTDAEVRDIDEEAFRQGTVLAKYRGEMTVPEELRYIQQTKSGGMEVEALVLQEIAADVIDNMKAGVQYLVGAGSTTAAVMESLSLENTLLGVDVVRDAELILADATENQLFSLVEAVPSRIVITVIGGQGHIFGRGNQQLSSRVIRAVGLDNLHVIATKTKLEGLRGKPLLVDTGDPSLDKELSGLCRVTTGYEDSVLCRVS